MATGREARAERLNERLRGAQRVNIASDDSFNLNIADLAGGPPTSPQQQEQEQAQSSPAKRRKTNNDASRSAAPNQSPAVRRSPRARDPYSQPDTSNESVRQPRPPPVPAGPRETRRVTSSPAAEQRPAGQVRPARAPRSAEPDELESSPAEAPITRTGTAPSRRIRVDEIPESPNAPSTAQRRGARSSSALASSARLQDATAENDDAPPSSSPTTRASQRRGERVSSSRLAPSARPPRSRSPIDAEDILSSDRVDEIQDLDGMFVEDAVDAIETAAGDITGMQDQTQVDEGAEGTEDEAQPIDETTAAATLGRKRPRRESSPQLGSRDMEDEFSPPNPKRVRPVKSPAVQRQGAPKPRTNTQKRPRQSAPAQPKKRAKPAPKPRRTSDDGNAAIELSVQRFVNHKARGGDDDDADPLQLDIPFANRSGESAVDVLSQICDEVVANTLEQLQAALDATTDTAKLKELRIKLRAVEAYREVLTSRFLQHTIYLDHWHSLRKRFRHVQKERVTLRDEILRLKGEREQVALRMDAVRLRHETNTKESTFLLETSTTMRDVDMAVTRGRDAPELSGKAQKEAELANLELAVAQISDQVSSSSSGGGLLAQLQDFNALLERTAGTLESR